MDSAATQLWRELHGRGYLGAYPGVRDYLAPFRVTTAVPAPTPRPPKAKKVTSRLMTNPGHLATDDKAQLAAILAECPELEALHAHTSRFADLLTQRRGRDLEKWMTAADASGLPGLRYSHRVFTPIPPIAFIIIGPFVPAEAHAEHGRRLMINKPADRLSSQSPRSATREPPRGCSPAAAPACRSAPTSSPHAYDSSACSPPRAAPPHCSASPPNFPPPYSPGCSASTSKSQSPGNTPPPATGPPTPPAPAESTEPALRHAGERDAFRQLE